MASTFSCVSEGQCHQWKQLNLSPAGEFQPSGFPGPPWEHAIGNRIPKGKNEALPKPSPGPGPSWKKWLPSQSPRFTPVKGWLIATGLGWLWLEPVAWNMPGQWAPCLRGWSMRSHGSGEPRPLPWETPKWGLRSPQGSSGWGDTSSHPQTLRGWHNTCWIRFGEALRPQGELSPNVLRHKCHGALSPQEIQTENNTKQNKCRKTWQGLDFFHEIVSVVSSEISKTLFFSTGGSGRELGLLPQGPSVHLCSG